MPRAVEAPAEEQVVVVLDVGVKAVVGAVEDHPRIPHAGDTHVHRAEDLIGHPLAHGRAVLDEVVERELLEAEESLGAVDPVDVDLEAGLAAERSKTPNSALEVHPHEDGVRGRFAHPLELHLRLDRRARVPRERADVVRGDRQVEDRHTRTQGIEEDRPRIDPGAVAIALGGLGRDPLAGPVGQAPPGDGQALSAGDLGLVGHAAVGANQTDLVAPTRDAELEALELLVDVAFVDDEELPRRHDRVLGQDVQVRGIGLFGDRIAQRPPREVDGRVRQVDELDPLLAVAVDLVESDVLGVRGRDAHVGHVGAALGAAGLGTVGRHALVDRRSSPPARRVEAVSADGHTARRAALECGVRA